jgi:hypothetical protein
LARSDIKTYPVTLGNRFETIALDLGKVDEYVWPIVLLDKPETLCIIEPFHRAFCHFFLRAFPWELILVVYIPMPDNRKAESRWVCSF